MSVWQLRVMGGTLSVAKQTGLLDRYSRPIKSPRAIFEHCLGGDRIAQEASDPGAHRAQALRAWTATVSRYWRAPACPGYPPSTRPFRSCATNIQRPVISCISTSRLGPDRSSRSPYYPITGTRATLPGPLGIESLFVTIDDHSRIGFTGMQASEGWPCAVAFSEALFVTSSPGCHHPRSAAGLSTPGE